MNTRTRILAGITRDDELYFLEIEPMSATHDYFAMSGFTVKPMLLEDAHQEVKDSLEDGELWRMAVEAERTTLGLDEWVDQVLETDGNLSGFDNSLFDEFVTVDGEEYIFKSEACGQHELTPTDLKHLFITTDELRALLEAWKKYHLKKVELSQALVSRGQYSLEYVMDKMPKQNITALAMQAITTINNEQ